MDSTRPRPLRTRRPARCSPLYYSKSDIEPPVATPPPMQAATILNTMKMMRETYKSCEERLENSRPRSAAAADRAAMSLARVFEDRFLHQIIRRWKTYIEKFGRRTVEDALALQTVEEVLPSQPASVFDGARNLLQGMKARARRTQLVLAASEHRPQLALATHTEATVPEKERENPEPSIPEITAASPPFFCDNDENTNNQRSQSAVEQKLLDVWGATFSRQEAAALARARTERRPFKKPIPLRDRSIDCHNRCPHPEGSDTSLVSGRLALQPKGTKRIETSFLDRRKRVGAGAALYWPPPNDRIDVKAARMSPETTRQGGCVLPEREERS